MNTNIKAISDNKIVLYTNTNGDVELRADVEKDTLWATLDQIAQLFGRDKSVVSRHIRNIFSSNELDRRATVAKNATVQNEGGREIIRNIEYFNLDVILSVGYRVNSKNATKFRIWATTILRNYLTKGYSLNKYTLENSEEKFDDLHEAIAFMESKKEGEEIKGKMTIKLTKNLVSK